MIKTFHVRIPAASLRAGVFAAKPLQLHLRVPQDRRAAIIRNPRKPRAAYGRRVRALPAAA